MTVSAKPSMKCLPCMALHLFVAAFVAAGSAPVPAQQLNLGAVQEMARIRTALGLSAEQEVRWREAELASVVASEARLRDQMRMQEALMSQHGTRENLAAIDLELERIQVASRLAREYACSKWLAVYDCLSDVQKQIAGEHLMFAQRGIDKIATATSQIHVREVVV